MTEHIPVLLQEVLEGLAIQEGNTVCDATVGGGGYTHAFCEAVGTRGTVIGIDQDKDAIEAAKKLLVDCLSELHLFVGNFRDIEEVVAQSGARVLDACAFDLGLSSVQLDPPDGGSGRGFSFQKDEPLLMTYTADPESASRRMTARDIVNTWPEESIANVLFAYGEERRARKLARAIVAAREEKPIVTTGELVRIVEETIGKRRHRHGGARKIHPATRTFQALRIAVNDELEALKEGLAGAVALLKPEGRVAVVSFHSLEDRIAKRFFKEQEESSVGRRITKKPITPSEEEIAKNPRSRSGKLRIFEKL